jgi:hypothetical protein
LREKCAKISGKNWTTFDFVFPGDTCLANFLANFESRDFFCISSRQLRKALEKFQQKLPEHSGV